MSDLVGNPEDRFSRVAAQIILAFFKHEDFWENPNFVQQKQLMFGLQLFKFHDSLCQLLVFKFYLTVTGRTCNCSITKTCPCIIQRFFSKFLQKNFDIFYSFAQNIDRGYTLEPPRRNGSNEYPGAKIRKNSYNPANPSFSGYIKVGFKGVYISRICLSSSVTCEFCDIVLFSFFSVSIFNAKCKL